MIPIRYNPENIIVDLAALRKVLRIKPTTQTPKEFESLINQAVEIAQPKALYLLAGIQHLSDNQVELEGIVFTSRILRVNLDSVHRAFPYIVTAGIELEHWGRSKDDPLTRFYADLIQEQILHSSREQLKHKLARTFALGSLSSMSPGSLEDWPIYQQIPFFSLFENQTKTIGVYLTPTLLMTPTKTVSGIFFDSEFSYASCQLCPRENCPNRKAVFEPELLQSRYSIPWNEN